MDQTDDAGDDMAAEGRGEGGVVERCDVGALEDVGKLLQVAKKMKVVMKLVCDEEIDLRTTENEYKNLRK